MSFFLLLLIIFFVIPLIRGFITFNRLKRNAREAFGNMQDRQSPPSGRKAGWSAPTPKPKKYARNEGEYVKFEEISVNETEHTTVGSDGSQQKYHAVEQQVVDAEWEEIK